MPTNYEKLLDLLRELFQLDQAKELDFGIYRIIAQREKEITAFLEKQLLPQVKEILGQTASGENAGIQAELDKAIKQAVELGVKPEDSPKVQELKVKLGVGGDIVALENEVFSHLYSFFRRYYHQGDFISQRRYKEGVYAIPYEGEEVKLHWANADQYYIKTTENFRDFTFKLPSGKRVHFKLVEASTEQDNKKAQEGKDRRFKLYEETPVAVENDELVIRFVYEVDKDNQKKLNDSTIETLLGSVGELAGNLFAKASEANDVEPWLRELAQKAPTDKNKDRTLLEKHLTQYTAKNSFDYFIHKDLKGFLSREMDFYIKNEMMHLDDIENEAAPKVETYLCKVKAFRRIGAQIITFLAQLEEFQKKLWLKKKFVVETNWCITLDHVFSIEDEKTRTKLLKEIAANDAQREEWVRLFAIDEIKADGIDGGSTRVYFAKNSGHIGYSVPLTVEFLKANRFLVLDTKFFSEEFKNTLLSHIHGLDESCNGLLVNSENSNALRLMRDRYTKQVKCIYIDPPYNTSEESFLYKNNYRHSSWCSMVANAISSSDTYLADDGVLGVAIDDLELHYLGLVCDEIFGIDARMGVLVVEIKPSGRTNDNYLATSHEYYLFYGKSPSTTEINFFDLSDEQKKQYGNEDNKGAYKWRDFLRTGGYSTPAERPNSFYPIYFHPETEDITLEKQKGYEEILPIDSEGKERVWRKTRPSFLQHLADNEISVVKTKGGRLKVQIIDRIKVGVRPKSVWTGSQYDAASHGTKLLKSLFGEFRAFSFPKAVYATHDVLDIISGHIGDAIILDYFAGSGTTGHAVIDMNRSDEEMRRYILVEMNDYFQSVLKPRIQKVVYATSWKDGKPQLQSPIKAKHTIKTSKTVSKDNGGQEQLLAFTAVLEGTEVEENPEFEADNPFGGVSQIIKYIRLESYEDCLNNLRLVRTQEQTAALDFGGDKVKQEYMLSYMLDVESRGSILNLKAFDEPDNYVLNVQQGDETVPTKVDLPETFNYLLGLRVRHVDVIRGVRVIEGLNPDGDRVLVLWRNAKEMDSDKLDDWFKKQGYNTKDMEYDLIYVNGDNNLENLRKDEHTWKVRLIEQEFHKLMFDVEDVC
jgi:adenine-specific DNA-methyltransferase